MKGQYLTSLMHPPDFFVKLHVCLLNPSSIYTAKIGPQTFMHEVSETDFF